MSRCISNRLKKSIWHNMA